MRSWRSGGRRETVHVYDCYRRCRSGTGLPLTIQELQLDDIRPGEVRVRMVASGVCHTDAIVRDGIYPTPLLAVLGHEGVGIVEAVGDAVTTVEPGDHVVLSAAYCERPLGCCRQLGRERSGARYVARGHRCRRNDHHP